MASHPLPKNGGFTLVELLVATATFIILLLIVASMINGASQVTALSDRKMSANSAARQVLDRISSDFKAAVFRRDLPQRIEKATGNDSITVYSQAQGYSGDRGIAKISYRVNAGGFRRGVEGTSWIEAPESTEVEFHAATLSPVANEADNSEVLSTDLFRFELSFFMADGSIKAAANAFFSPDGSDDPSQTVQAVIVTIAALDGESRALVQGGMESIAALFPDAVDGTKVSLAWGELLQNPAFYQGDSATPVSVRAAIRIYERYYFIQKRGSFEAP